LRLSLSPSRLRRTSTGEVGDPRSGFDNDSLRAVARLTDSGFPDQRPGLQGSTGSGRLAQRADRAARGDSQMKPWPEVVFHDDIRPLVWRSRSVLHRNCASLTKILRLS